MYTVDARNHGDSPHTEDLSYPLLAEDLLLFLQQHSIPTATLIGHSMGGRAVMAAALTEVGVERERERLQQFEREWIE